MSLLLLRVAPAQPDRSVPACSYTVTLRTRLLDEYGPGSVLPIAAARTLGAPVAGLLRLLPRSPELGDTDHATKGTPRREAETTLRRMRRTNDALEAGIGARARCSRGCGGMLTRVWCLSLRLRHPLVSLFTRYDPWLGRVSRLLLFFAGLAGPLWILAAWYDYLSEGFISFLPVPVDELTVQNFLPLVGIAIAAAILHIPVNLILGAVLSWAGYAQFDLQHPAVADELRRRAAFESKADELSLPELRAVVSQLLRVRVTAARSALAAGRRSGASQLDRVVSPGLCDRLHWKTCAAHLLLLAYLIYSLVFVTLFSSRRFATRDAATVNPPRGALLLAEMFIAWLISIAVGQFGLQPLLLLGRVVWEFVLFPDLASWAARAADEWCFDVIAALSPIPPYALRTSTLGARLATVGLAEAAGAASGLSREHALVAYGVAPVADGTIMHVVQQIRRAADDDPPPPALEREWRDLMLQLYLVGLVVKQGDVETIMALPSSGPGPRVVAHTNYGTSAEVRLATARRAAQARTSAREDLAFDTQRGAPSLPPLGRRATAEVRPPAVVDRDPPGDADAAEDPDGLTGVPISSRAGRSLSGAARYSSGHLGDAPAGSPARGGSGGPGGRRPSRYSVASRASGGSTAAAPPPPPPFAGDAPPSQRSFRAGASFSGAAAAQRPVPAAQAGRGIGGGGGLAPGQRSFAAAGSSYAIDVPQQRALVVTSRNGGQSERFRPAY